MGCDAGRACIHDHVFPRLDAPKPKADGGYKALAPCHDDRTHSLSVSIGGTGRVIWHCFAGCDSETTRKALIKAGVPGECLRRPSDDAARFEEIVNWLVFGDSAHADKVIRLAAYVRGYGDDLPGGAELRTLAEDCGVSLAEAYRARGKT